MTVVEWLRLPDVPVTVSVYVPAGVPPVVAGFTVSKVVLVVPPYDAEMVTDVEAVTALVVTANVALVAPAATVTLAGTAAADPLLERATTAPPVGAAPPSVTVPVDGVPPLTVAGLSATEDSAAAVAGFTVSKVVLVVPPYDAEMVIGVGAVTALVVTVNVALVAPAATVTLAGTVAADPVLEGNDRPSSRSSPAERHGSR